MKKNKIERERFNPNKIPLLGSLGILALGDVGFEAWREVKIKYNKRKVNGKK